MFAKQDNNHQLASCIMQHITRYRRGWCTTHHHDHGLNCWQPHWDKLLKQIELNQPIQFILPAFPAKSPNRNKTFGSSPDLGEKLALRFLNELGDFITSFYAPGAEIIICSDGRVFNDLVKVDDEAVDHYTKNIARIIHQENLYHLKTVGLDHYYARYPYDAMRKELVAVHGESIDAIKWRIKTDATEKMLFNGVHRFVFEDHLSLLPALTRNQVRKMTKEIAYQVIQRSHAWSHLLAKHFGEAIRLSIHPQPCGAEKLGIMLLKSKDHWATPWHRVVLFDGHDYILTRKSDAEKIGATMVFADQHFSHYTLSLGE